MEIINITDEIIEVNVTEAVVNVVTQNGAYPLPSNVFSVFGRVGNVVGQIGDYTTSIVEEGTNLYYTQARFDTAFGNKTTTDLDEGTNLYYTDARSRAAISENITGLEYSSASGIFSLASGYVIPTQAMLDAKVPYTGATGNVNLGEYQLSAGQVTFDQTPTGAAGVGVMRWNDTDGTLDLGLKGGNVTLQIGQEQVKRVVNGTGINLTEAAYQVVKVSGAQGQRLQVTLAQANNDLNSATTLGIVTENIDNNQEGFITTSGEVRGINTTGSLQGETWTDGDILYLSPSVAGKITNIKPIAPNHMVIVGYVEYAHQNNGKIFVKVDNGYEIGELHDVDTAGEATNDGLFLDSDNVWRPRTIAEVLGYTPVTSARTISTTAPLTGGGDLSADRTISMPAATTSVSGYLTSTDWNTFNNKEGAVTAGTTAQYYRGDKTFQTLDTLAVAENTNLYYTQARFDTAFSGKSTTNLAEGTNLYYTDARARAAISGTAPIDVSGGVVSISQASGSSNGYLSSTDWNTFNGKQAALNGTGFVKINGTTISYDNSTYLTTISGITAGGELSGTYPNPTLVNSAVTGKVLTGLNLTGGGTIADTDSILGAFGKVQNQISALVGGVMYEGTWDASTNTPTIVSSVGAKGDYYIVSVAGSTNINGITSWNIGDWIIFNGTTWDKVDNTDAVSSVNGYTGAVSLVTSDVPESGNLYFTNDRAIGSTLTGYTSGAGTISSSDSILQAIQKLNGNVSGLVTGVSSVFGRTGAVVAASGDYTTTQVTEGTNLYYTEARVSANTDVAANTAARHASVTLGTANGLSLSTQQLSLGLASGSATGALSSTDWNTFNNKQAALTIGNITSADSSVMTISGGTGAIIGSGVSLTLLAATGTNGGIVTTGTQTFAGAKTFSNSITATQGIFAAQNGNSTDYNYLVFNNLESGYGDWNFYKTGSNDLGIGYGTTAGSSYTNAMILKYGGNIGINDSSPALRLAVRAADAPTTPTLGTASGHFIIGNGASTISYGLMFGVNGDGHSWMQSQRIDGTATAYNLLLQPKGGNVGIGTSSPTNGKLEVQQGATSAGLWVQTGGTTSSYTIADFRTGTNAPALQLLGSGTAYFGGFVGMGVSTPSDRLVVNGNLGVTDGVFQSGESYSLYLGDKNAFMNSTFGQKVKFGAYNGFDFGFGENSDLTLSRVWLSITSTGQTQITCPTSSIAALAVRNSAASVPAGQDIIFTASPNNTTSAFLYCVDGTEGKFVVWSNGDVDSRTNSYGGWSDIKLKENITDATPKLQDLLKVKVKNYNFIGDDKKQLGVVAQELEEIFPGLVSESPDYKTDEETGERIDLGTTTKSVKYSVFVPMLIKAIQEQQAQIEELKQLINK